jgi:hypothetical protein
MQGRVGYFGSKKSGLYWMQEEWGYSGSKESGLFGMQEEGIILEWVILDARRVGYF